MVKLHKLKEAKSVIHVHKASIAIILKNNLHQNYVNHFKFVKSVQSANPYVEVVHSITLRQIIVNCVLLVIIAGQELWLTLVQLVTSVTSLTSSVNRIHRAMRVKLGTIVQKGRLGQWIVHLKRWVLLTKPCNRLTVKLVYQVIFVLMTITLRWNVPKVTTVLLVVETLSMKSKYMSVKLDLGVLWKNWFTKRNAKTVLKVIIVIQLLFQTLRA